MQIILGIALGLAAGAFCLYFLIKKEIIKQKAITNSDIQKQQSQLNLIKQSIDYETNNLSSLKDRQIEIQNSIDLASSNADEALKQFSEKSFSVYTEWLSSKEEKEKVKYENNILDFQKEYSQVMEDSANEFSEIILQKQFELNDLTSKLEKQMKIVNAIIAANKREEEKRQQESFYKLHLSEQDIIEIKQLQTVGKSLRDPTPLNKVIWKYYFENPYNDLSSRVVGKEVKTGIYKITNTINGMCYIGQAVNIADRFKQHIKRGLGAETATKNKLYPAMQEFGLENFSFEIIEECTREDLNAKEDYYQEIFKAKEFGYSIK